MKVKKIISMVLCMAMVLPSASCSKQSSGEVKTEIVSSQSGAVSSISEKNNKITRYFDEYRIGDGNLSGYIPAAACGDQIYYIKDSNSYAMDDHSAQTSGYTVDLRSFSVEPDGTGEISGGKTIFCDEQRIVYCPEDSACLFIRDLASGNEKKTELERYPSYSGYDSDGNIYLYINGDVCIYSSEGILSERYSVYEQLEDAGMKNRYIYDMCVSGDGKVYFTISEKGKYHSVFVLDENGKLKNITGNITDLADNVNRCFCDKDGNIVLCTGYGTCLADVISPETGITVRRYELYGVNDLIGPSENSDMIYVKSDGIYSYDYIDDSSEMVLSDETLPQLANSFRSAVISGNRLSLRLASEEKNGGIAVYNTSTGQTDLFEAPECCCGTTDGSGNFYFVTGELRLDGDENGSFETVRNTVYQMDKNGEIKILFTLPQYHSEVYADSIETDSSGNFVFLYPESDNDYRSSVFITDRNGNVIKTIPSESEEYYDGYRSLFRTTGGELMAAYSNGVVYRLNEDTYELEQTDFSSDEYLIYYDGSEEYDYYYSTLAGVYGYDAAENRSDELMLWAETDSQVNYYSRDDMIVSPETIFSGNGIKLIKADEKRLEELNSREVITLAVSGVEIKPFVEYFNRTNEKYRIYLKDYLKYGTDGFIFGSGKDSEQLAKDIIDGDIPDIIMLDDMDLSDYIVKDIFTDYKEFINNDTEIDISDIDEKIVKEFTFKGSLYTVPAFLSSNTMLTADEHKSWDYSDMISYAENNSHALDGSAKNSLKYILISDFLHDHTDLENGKTDIDNEEFRKVIRFVKDNSEISEEDDYYEYAQENVIAERGISDIRNFYAETSPSEWRRDTPYAAGFPGTDGGKRYVYPFFSFAVTKQSSLKEGAWEFVRMFLKSDFRETAGELNCSDIPYYELISSNKKVQDTDINSNGNIISAFEEVPFSDETQNAFREYLKMPVFSDLAYKGIDRIVFDELESYYSGAVSEEEVSKTLQSKISLYLNEIL